MSRSRPVITNPAVKFFQWSGSKGELQYYDREKKKNISVPFPFVFLVLDQLSTITGYSEADENSFWSNEVRKVSEEPFIVKTAFKGRQFIKEEGLYKDLDVRNKGAKYAKSIYIMFDEGEGYVIGNIKASGAALTAWIEFCKTCIVENGKVVFTGKEKAKKGTNEYFVPSFEYAHSDNNENDIAIELDKELQSYLDIYLSKRGQTDKPEDDEVFIEGYDLPEGAKAIANEPGIE
jgi:hypothetical protein